MRAARFAHEQFGNGREVGKFGLALRSIRR